MLGDRCGHLGSAGANWSTHWRRRDDALGSLGLRRHGSRHDQGEGAALARLAMQLDAPTEHRGQLSRDRQAEPGAAEAAIGRAIGLAERLEDDLLLVERNADARVFDRERKVASAGPG